MPCDYSRYPESWFTEIRPAILDRAGHCCEGSPRYPDCRAADGALIPGSTERVVLTVAHLDHVPEISDPAGLRAWCQRCHNAYDAPRRIIDKSVCNAQLRVTPRYATLRRAAIAFFGEAGDWAYRAWKTLNRGYFDDALTPRPLLWGLTPHGHALGHYQPSTGAITLHPSLLQPAGDAWGQGEQMGRRYAADVLLHEMVHAAVRELRGYDGPDSHNNAAWCAEIERITWLLMGRRILAAPIRQRRIDGRVAWHTEAGHLTRAQIAGWPHSLRPPEYYQQQEAVTHD